MKRSAILLVFSSVLFFLAGCDNPSGQPYRLPYVDGTEVTIAVDHEDHTTPVAEMFDIKATLPDQWLAAAAPGWMREIKDSGDSSASTNNYVWIEHPLDYCQPDTRFYDRPSPPKECKTCAEGLSKCNEWTLYAHMAKDSVTVDAGLSVDDWVEAGQAIGIEGDVGFTPGGRHVHFTIFTIDRDTITGGIASPTVNGDYEPYAEIFGRTELVPLFCTASGYAYPRTGDTHIAGPCP